MVSGPERGQPTPPHMPVSEAPTGPLPLGATIVQGFESWIDCIAPLTAIALVTSLAIVAVGAASWSMVSGLPPSGQWFRDGQLLLSADDAARLFGFAAIVGFAAFLATGAQRAASTVVVAAHLVPDGGHDGRVGASLRLGLRALPKIVATEVVVVATAAYGIYFMLVPFSMAAGAANSASGSSDGASPALQAASVVIAYVLAIGVAVVLSPAIPAIVLERRKTLGGIERGFRLAFPYFFRLFAVLFVAGTTAAIGMWVTRLLVHAVLPQVAHADVVAQGVAWLVFGSLWIAMTTAAFLAMTGVTRPE